MNNAILDKLFPQNYSLQESDISLSFREQSLISVAKGQLLQGNYLFLIERKELDFSDVYQLYHRFSSSSPLKVVFLLKGNSRNVARQMMDESIAFITERGFVFIPQGLIYGPLPSPVRKEALLWHDSYIPIAQYFLMNPSSRLNSLQLQAEMPFYSRSLLIKALAILTQLSFLRQEGVVRSTTYSLAHSLAESYSLIKERFTYPIHASYYVRAAEAGSLPKEVLSSESALDYYTDVVPEEEAYLMSRKDFQQHRVLFLGEKERKFDEVYIRYDILNYTPLLVHEEQKNLLNPLDVIAIYRKDDDPRVSLAIDRLEKKFL